MILECPNCSARFLLSSEALGTEGREVRCGKCSTSWFQPPERDSLDELPQDESTSPFEQTQRKSDNAVRGEERDPEIASLIETAINQKDPMNVDFVDDPKPTPEVKKAGGKKRHIFAILAAIIITAALAGVFALSSNSLGKSSPFMGAAYAKFGMSPAADKPKVAFDRLKLSRNGKAVAGTGYLINLTSEDISLDKIYVELIDMDYKVLKSSEIKLKDGVLKSESSQKIDFSFAEAPREAVSVRASVTQ